MTGSSNTLLEFGNLINFLAPDEYHIQRDGEMIGASAVADVVIENGKASGRQQSVKDIAVVQRRYVTATDGAILPVRRV